MKKGLKIGGRILGENPQIVARLYRFFSIARFRNGSSIRSVRCQAHKKCDKNEELLMLRALAAKQAQELENKNKIIEK